MPLPIATGATLSAATLPLPIAIESVPPAVALLPKAIDWAFVAVAAGPIAIALTPVAPVLSWFPVTVEFTEKYFTLAAFS